MIVEDSIKDEGRSKHFRKHRKHYDRGFMKAFPFNNIVARVERYTAPATDHRLPITDYRLLPATTQPLTTNH